MLFSRVLAFSTLAMAVPSTMVEIDARQVTGTGPISMTLFNIANIFATAIGQNAGIFNATAANITSAGDQAIQSVITGLQAVEAALTSATDALVAGTTNTTGGLLGLVGNLTQTEVNNIGNATKTLVNTLYGLGPILSVNTANVTSTLKDSLQSEIKTVKGLLTTFVAPIVTIAGALSTVSPRFNTQTFTDAYNALQTFFNKIGAQI